MGLVRLDSQDGPAHGVRTVVVPGATGIGIRGYLGYREDAPSPLDRWETPAGEVVLVLGLRDQFLAQASAGVGEPARFSMFVAGLHDRPTRTVCQGRQLGLQVRLDPLAAHALLRIPMDEAHLTREFQRLAGRTPGSVFDQTAARWSPTRGASDGCCVSTCATPTPPRGTDGSLGPLAG
jgi:hypothetical protein